LLTMLRAECEQLSNVLPQKQEDARFFAFCNTVESLNYHKTNQGQGWVGIRFQQRIGGPFNDIILHVKMHDISNKAQQEALGILGVNLIFGAFYRSKDQEEFVDSLVSRLPRERIEIDMLRFSGPDFEEIDNRMIALSLVRKGITDATMFDLAKNVLQPATALYKKNILLMRGRFRPVTHVHVDMIENGKVCFLEDPRVKHTNVEVIFELTLKDLTADGKISDKDFLDRAELLSSLGYTVMISNYLKHYKMVEYLSAIAKGHFMGVILGVYNLSTIFDERYYDNLPGGLLEAFGRGFGHNVKLYVYPAIDVDSGSLLDMYNLELPVHLKGLMDYMVQNDKIAPIRNFNEKNLHIMSDDVLSKIKGSAKNWEEDVPYEAAQAIKFFELFGYSKA
ncbi:MAG: TonB-dependent receptor, partial [Flavobacteriales bacterium]